MSRVWRYSSPPGGTHSCTLVCAPETKHVCEPPMLCSSTAVPARASSQTSHSSTRHRATLDRHRSHPTLIVPHRRCRIGSYMAARSPGNHNSSGCPTSPILKASSNTEHTELSRIRAFRKHAVSGSKCLTRTPSVIRRMQTVNAAGSTAGDASMSF